MAKYECELYEDFDTFLNFCEDTVLNASVSASLEDGSDFASEGVRVAVRVYERYSAFGGNRVSLSLTLAGDGRKIFLSAITAGGSQAMFFKINTIGEEAFLNTLVGAIKVEYGG